jgi:hypothetical protein
MSFGSGMTATPKGLKNILYIFYIFLYFKNLILTRCGVRTNILVSFKRPRDITHGWKT